MSTATLEKNVLLEMKPDIQAATPGYSLDMLQDLLTVAEFVSLHFYLSNDAVSIINGITYVKEPAYKSWARHGF